MKTSVHDIENRLLTLEVQSIAVADDPIGPRSAPLAQELWKILAIIECVLGTTMHPAKKLWSFLNKTDAYGL